MGLLDENLPSYGLLGSPQSGALMASNYPNQYGLRAYLKSDGTYGGQMMPKHTGWKGLIPSRISNDVITEMSVGSDIGEFPLVVPSLTNEQLTIISQLKENDQIPDDIYRKAEEFARARQALGLSPFKDIWDK
jgi:hypothetical protein